MIRFGLIFFALAMVFAQNDGHGLVVGFFVAVGLFYGVAGVLHVIGQLLDERYHA